MRIWLHARRIHGVRSAAAAPASTRPRTQLGALLAFYGYAPAITSKPSIEHGTGFSALHQRNDKILHQQDDPQTTTYFADGVVGLQEKCNKRFRGVLQRQAGVLEAASVSLQLDHSFDNQLR